jgi:hypothetical protein
MHRALLRVVVIGCIALPWRAAQAQAPADTARPPVRLGIEFDPDPAGALIERRELMKLDDAQFAALRSLRHWHQRRVRAMQDSLDRLNIPINLGIGIAAAPPGRGGGAPGGGAPGGGAPGSPGAGGAGGGRAPARGNPVLDRLPAEQRAVVRSLADSVRTWTVFTRDSALAILRPAQKDSLAAAFARMRDSMPVRGGRPRPPR